MSEAYEREQYAPYLPEAQYGSKLTLNLFCRQNNSRLSELSSKVSALRGVTVDIYDNARNQDLIDNSVRPLTKPSPLHK